MGVSVSISVGPVSTNGTRTAVFSYLSHKAAKSFPILPGETSLDVRILVDRSIVEFFVSGGRAVYTARYYPEPGSGGNIVVVANTDTAFLSAKVYEMGCGWTAE